MKNAIIKTVDYITYLLFAFIFLTAGFMMLTGSVFHATIFLVSGWLVACLLSGVWFCLSQIAVNSAKTNELLQKLLDK